MEIEITLKARVELHGDFWLILSEHDRVLVEARTRREAGEKCIQNVRMKSGMEVFSWKFID